MMGWVVSKPLKQNLSGNEETQSTFGKENFGSIIPIEYFDGNEKETNISNKCKLDTPPSMPKAACDILVIDHEIELFSVSNTIKFPFSRAESLCSIPVALDNRIELSTNAVEGSLTNFAISSTSKVMICPTAKKKSIKCGKFTKTNENRSNSFVKSKKSKQPGHLKKEKNSKNSSSKTFSSKPPNANVFKINNDSANESSSLSLKKRNLEFLKPLKTTGKLISNKKTLTKNTNPILPSLALKSNKNSRNKTPNKSENKATIQQKKTSKKNNNLMALNLENIKIKEENTDRNVSPVTVDEREKQLFFKSFEMKDSDLVEEKQYLSSFVDKKRPATACSTAHNSRENFDVIIEDFNRKLEKLIKENHMINCLCENCNRETNLTNKTTAGKITFFFLKRYGNFGKFILARLNEFLDNVYQISPNRTEDVEGCKSLGNSFPLPCNRKDIEYEGDLKPYCSFLKEDFIPNQKNSKSKLPKLILKNKIKFQNQNTNNETKIMKKIEFKNHNRDKESDKGCDFKTILPPLKPASSIMNFCKTSNFDKTNLIYQTLNLNSEQSINGFLNILYDEKIVQSCVNGSGATENGIRSVGFETPLIFDESNEDEITVMANKIIDDLWKSTFLNGCRTKSIISD